MMIASFKGNGEKNCERPNTYVLISDFYLRFAEYFQVIDSTYIGIPKESTYLR